MRINSPIHRKHARIEIIPLIDVMFFLLASFMMVSLDMTKVENTAVDLPPATIVRENFGGDMIHVAVDKTGKCWMENKPIQLPELYTVLTNRFHLNAQLPLFIGGDAATHEGDMVAVLEVARRAGLQNIAFTVRAEKTP
jgi:biopolymer transport protein ExbD